MENKKNILIIVLVVIIAILCLTIGWLLGSKVGNSEPETNDDNNGILDVPSETKKYKAYKQGEEIKLSDNSEWIILKDSSVDIDYITLLSKKDYTPVDNNYDLIFDELVVKETQFNNSQLKQYLQSLENQMPVTLKEVDGYKIRLITIEEIFSFNNNWQYNSINDSYNYIGEKVNENLNGILTMSHTKCTEGKCTAFYNLSETQCIDENCNKQYYLEHWVSGLSGIKPVINVSKDVLNTK